MPSQTDHAPTPQRDITRQRMIESAIALLEREGFAAMSWRTIAREAGVTGGVLQYHFGSKAALLEAVFEQLCADHARRLREAGFIDGASVRERLTAFVDAAFDLLAGPRGVAMLEVVVGTRTDADAVLSTEALSVMNATFDDLWSELFADVELDPARLTAARHLLFATLYGFCVQRLFRPGLRFRNERSALIDAVACLLTDAPAPKEGSDR